MFGATIGMILARCHVLICKHRPQLLTMEYQSRLSLLKTRLRGQEVQVAYYVGLAVVSYGSFQMVTVRIILCTVIVHLIFGSCPKLEFFGEYTMKPMLGSKKLLPISCLMLGGLSLAGCQPAWQGDATMQKEIQRFAENQDSFRQLTVAACNFKEKLEQRSFRYPDNADQLTPALKVEFAPVKQLLKDLKLKRGITIREYEDSPCTLYASVFASGLATAGRSYSFAYQPQDLGNFEYNEQFFSVEQTEQRRANRRSSAGTKGESTTSFIRFTIALDDGWYIQYTSAGL